jgi:hypothetical protein
MGRGRAKAKQTKVARKLKYHSPDTDLAALQRELGSSSPAGEGEFDDDLEDDDEDEDDETSGEDEDGSWASRRSR